MEIDQVVLRCRQCNKPFDKESTLKRHGYYCRSRRAPKASRLRSCLSCAKVKAKCDNKRPGCSRCVGKNIECHYPANATSEPVATQETSDQVPDNPFDKYFPALDHDPIAVFDNQLALPDINFGNANSFGWNDSSLDFDSILESMSPYPSPESLSSKTQPSPPSIFGFDDMAFLRPSIPLVPSSDIRTLVKRPNLSPGPQRVASLLFQNLRSYPLMMLRDNALPPFVHPALASSAKENGDMEFLTNCISLAQMIRPDAGGRGNRKLFWKNVCSECERMIQDCQSLNQLQLLAAMQALLIYILFRIDEGESEHNNLDSLFIAAVSATAKQFSSQHIDFNKDVTPGASRKSWRDFLFEESGRRMTVVFQILNMLIYFSPALMCDLHVASLILAPLPCAKGLWEAPSAQAFEAQQKKMADPHAIFGLGVNGDLIRLAGDVAFTSDMILLNDSLSMGSEVGMQRADWSEWLAGQDGFGGLVMLVASLVGS